MGAADVVPGVSGGTIAFITGIYEELIQTISSINFDTFRTLFKEGPKAFWKAVNGNFLLVLFLGIAASIITLAQVISVQLENNPVMVWAFFFGLVAASIPLVAKRVNRWAPLLYFGFAIGAITAFLITELPILDNSDEPWYLFLSGAVAICAMILPGISGSFILVLMGSYVVVLDAVNNRDLVSIATIGAGAIIGLLLFSRVLKWMFERFHDITIAVLSGFLLGSLNKIWPWKNPLKTFTKYAGTDKEKTIILQEEKVWPWNYEALVGESAQLPLALVLCLLGVLIIWGMDRLAAKKS